MEIIKNTITNKSLFRIVYVLFLSINMIPIVNIQKPYSIILAILLLWAVFLIIKDVFKQGVSYFTSKKQILPLLFLTICFISLLINIKRIGFSGFISFAFTIVSILILFKFDGENTIDYKKEIYWVNLLFGIVLFVALSISLYMYFFQQHFTIIAKAGHVVNLGFFENRLFGIFSSPNVGATYSILGLFGVFINLFALERKPKKKEVVFYCFLSLFCLLYISKSGSRGALSCVLVAIVVYVFFAPFKNFEGWKKVAIRVLSGIVSVFCFLFFINFFNLAMNYVPPVIEYVTMTIQGQEPPSISPPLDNSRIEDDRDDIDISNKRFDIWKAHIALVDKDFLFGIGSSDYNKDELSALVKSGNISNDNSKFITFAKGNTHNGYLNIFVKCGLIALILFLTIVVVSIVKLFKTKHLLWNNRLIAVCISIVSYFLANNVMESNMVLMGANVFQVFFWLYAGLIVMLVEKHVENSKNKKTENINMVT